MATIEPNKKGKVIQAQRRLKERIRQLNRANELTAGQRDQLFAQNLIEVNRILLYIIGREEEVE